MPHKPRRILALETSGRSGSVALATDINSGTDAATSATGKTKCASQNPEITPAGRRCHMGLGTRRRLFEKPGDCSPRPGAHLVAAARLSGDMRHAGELMPTIDRLLREQAWPADSITDVFVSIGPGSFTGLRIGVTVARTLAWSIGAKVVAVPTLDCLARNALAADPPPPHLAVVLDAKRSQIYTAAFDLGAGTCRRIIDACLADPREFFARCPRPLAVLGEGVTYHRAAIDESDATVLDPSLWPARAEHVFYVGLELADAGNFTDPGDLLPLYIRRPEAEEKWEELHLASRQ